MTRFSCAPHTFDLNENQIMGQRDLYSPQLWGDTQKKKHKDIRIKGGDGCCLMEPFIEDLIFHPKPFHTHFSPPTNTLL